MLIHWFVFVFVVMVWLHGGAFQQGSGDRPEYNARRLAQEERVVVVTVNYRLGALGFLVSNELGLNGNYGLVRFTILCIILYMY